MTLRMLPQITSTHLTCSPATVVFFQFPVVILMNFFDALTRVVFDRPHH